MKRVHVSSHGPLALDPSIEIGWEDVWLRVCSGRRTLRLAPCLISREHLRSDIAICEKIAADPKAEMRELHLEDAAKMVETLALVDRHGVVISDAPLRVHRGSDPGKDFAVTDVYTSRPWINKAEAEHMLDVYLESICLRRCVYKWKRPSLVVWPTTVAVHEEGSGAN